MRGQYGAVVVVVVIIVSSLSFALPGAGSIDTPPVSELEREQPDELVERRSGERTDAVQSPVLSDVDALHEAGIDGDGVTVGVIGQGFTEDQRSLNGAVVESRQFGGSVPVLSGSDHDTAVAEIVTKTAPESDLYLAGVGREATPERYASAVEWLLAQDVDIVVDAASYFPATPEGMTRFNDVATDAADSGVVFVTSAGNSADRHWAGTASETGWVEFAPDRNYNTVGNGSLAGQTSLRLYWEGDAEFDLYLYRTTPGEDTLVAKSTTNQTGEGRHSEAIDTTLPSGSYYVAIRGGAGAAGTDIELFAARHELGASSGTGGMVAPATAENVIAVGAADAVSGGQQPYSSAGPRLDISAPDGARTQAAGELDGSSAAAPLVAGTIALMASQNESLSPTAAQRVLQRTATRDGGRLYLDTTEAVAAVASQPIPQQTRYGPAREENPSPSGADGTQFAPPLEFGAVDTTRNESAAEDSGSTVGTRDRRSGPW